MVAVNNYPVKRILVAAALVLLVVVSACITMANTSSMDYCMTCHEMERYKHELLKSSHAKDENGKQIECRQCHLPPEVGMQYVAVKSISGMKDIVAHNFKDVENLDRRSMQNWARRFVVDENCLACHQDLHKDVKGKELSIEGRLSHDAYLNKNGNTSRSCAGCHFNMAHLPDFDRRYAFNAEFAQRIDQEDPAR